MRNGSVSTPAGGSAGTEYAADLLQKLAEQGGSAKPDGKGSDAGTVRSWRSGWQTLGRMKEIGAAKVALAKELRTIKQQIETTQRELEQLNNNQQDDKVAVVHLQSGGGKLSNEAELPLADAGCCPVYNADLDTADG